MSEITISFEEGCLYVDNFGNKVELPDYCQKTIEKIKKLEKQAARREKGSNNYQATIMKIRDRRRAIKAQIHDFVEMSWCIPVTNHQASQVAWMATSMLTRQN